MVLLPGAALAAEGAVPGDLLYPVKIAAERVLLLVDPNIEAEHRIEELEMSWSRTMSWDELADLCARMTERRKQIRRERGIQPPKTRCSKCGIVSQSDISAVSIRSALFALRNNGVITGADFKELDKSWTKHRQKNGLDAYGQ